MKIWLSAFVADGIMFYLLWLGLHGNDMALNFVLFMTWALKITVGALMWAALSSTKGEEALLDICRKHAGKSWDRYDMLTDVIFCAGLASGGWFLTAALALFVSVCWKSEKTRVVIKYSNVKQEVSQ